MAGVGRDHRDDARDVDGPRKGHRGRAVSCGDVCLHDLRHLYRPGYGMLRPDIPHPNAILPVSESIGTECEVVDLPSAIPNVELHTRPPRVHREFICVVCKDDFRGVEFVGYGMLFFYRPYPRVIDIKTDSTDTENYAGSVSVFTIDVELDVGIPFMELDRLNAVENHI